MKTSRQLSQLSTDQLVALYVDLSLEMKRADDEMENGAYNRAHKKLREIEAELKSRPGDARHAVLPLLAHGNVQVRLNAAITTIAISPDAEAALRGIAPLGFPQSIEAKALLRGLERGSWKPT